jgi:hypothetical protein
MRLRFALRQSVQKPAALAFAAVLANTAGFALSDGDIFGNWCGSESTYSISRTLMKVTRVSDSAQLAFDVTEVKRRDATISVSWRRADGKVVRTEFTDFSADGLKMVQLSNTGGPRREFKRC